MVTKQNPIHARLPELTIYHGSTLLEIVLRIIYLAYYSEDTNQSVQSIGESD